MSHKQSLSRRQYLQASAWIVAAIQTPAAYGNWQQSVPTKLRLLTESPINAETPLSELISNYWTPQSSLYIRTNGNVPVISADSHEIAFEGMIDKPGRFSVADLRNEFGDENRNAVLLCAGNRRTEMNQIKKVSGTPWTTGAVGNATWTGVSLTRILESLGVHGDAKHIWFESVDRCILKSGSETAFGASIPIEKGLDGSVVLAHSINDQPLNSEHGAPVRAIVPGYIGARCVKWLGRVVISDRVSPNHFVAESYKMVEDTRPESLAAAKPIGEYLINSLICDPAPDANVPSGEIAFRGIAIPGGRESDRIARVELLSDDHRVIGRARLDSASEAYCWVHWSANIELPRGRHTVLVRATGTQGDQQSLEPNWNALGYQYNAPHRVTIEVV